jgi:hypothetical protein
MVGEVAVERSSPRQPRTMAAMSTLNEKPSIEFLWAKYSYNPFTGALHRKDTDRELKGNHSTRSHQLSIHAKARHPYAVVVWAFMAGVWPNKIIDHIDRNCYNHSWWNLREVTLRENNLNTDKAVRGAYLTPSGRWRSQIQINKKNKYLGIFDTKEEAQAAYEKELKIIVNH